MEKCHSRRCVRIPLNPLMVAIGLWGTCFVIRPREPGDVVTVLRVGESGFRISARAKHFSLWETSRQDLGTVQPPIQWLLGFFPGGKTAGAWTWQLPPSAEFRNEWSYTSASLISPHGVDKYNVNFLAFRLKISNELPVIMLGFLPVIGSC